MRVRTLLLSTVLTLSAAGVSQAYAAQVLKPQGTWAVTKVDAKTPGSAPYCALARRFSNGSIVTFARNAANETSVAVDFPPGSFKPSQNYTIVLDSGAGETRSYKTQPVSERGIVIRMGKDDRFYQALNQSGKLGVSVDDQSYTFTMPDVKNGTQDLSACLGVSDQPTTQTSDAETERQAEISRQAAAVVTSKPPVEAATAKPKEEVSERVSTSAIPASDSEIQAVKEENIRLRNALERERRTYEDKMQQNDSASTSAELNEKLQLLQSENAQLKDKINNASKSASVVAAALPVPAPVPVAACPVAKIDDTQLNILKSENAQLKTDLDAQKQQASLKQQPDPQIATLKAENEQLKSTIAEDKNASKQPDPMVASLKTENDQLKADLEAQKQRVTLKPDDTQLNTLKAENVQLKADLDAQKAEVASLTAAQKQAASKPPVVDIATPALKDQVAKLQSENSTLKAQLIAKQAVASASSGDPVEGAATVAKLHSVEEELTQAKADRDRLSGQIDAMAKANGDGHVKISSDNWNLEQATERYNQAEQEIRRMGATVEQERAKCSVEKKNIEAMLFDPKIATKEQQAKLVSLENEVESLKKGQGKVDAGVNDKAVAELTQKLAAAINENETLRKNLSDNSRQVQAASVQDTAQVDALKQQLASSNAEIDQLKKDLDAANQPKVASNEPNPEVEALKQEITNLNSQVASVQSEKADLANKLDKISTSSGGSDVKAATLSARPNSVVPRPVVEIDTAELDRPAMDKPVSVIPSNVESTPVPEIARAVEEPDSLAIASEPLPTPQFAAPVSTLPVGEISSAVPSVPGKLMSKSDVANLLQVSGIQVSGPVEPVASSTGAVSYHWSAEDMKGTAEQKTMDKPMQYDRFVQDYLDKSKSGCKGQFAAIPGMVNMNGGNRVSVYETACVNEKSDKGTSSAVVFYNQSGTFTAIAHAAPSDSMDGAMDARDKIVAALDAGKIASR